MIASMRRLIITLSSIIVIAATAAAAGAQQQVGQTPPYSPGTSTWQEGPPNAGAGHILINRPYPWGQTSLPFPLITSSFRKQMQPDSVRISLDGRDVTDIAQVKSGGFEFTPAFSLSVGPHAVRITGTTLDGRPISDGWSFTVTP
jgi:hypothetical protein